MAVNQDQLVTLYLAYFGRPPDADGLAFYLAQPAATVESVAAAFSASPESLAMYGAFAVSPAATIDAIYLNLFNRHAEPDGLAFWTNQVLSGQLSPALAAWAIAVGAQNEDKVTVDNKTFASNVWLAHLDTPAERTGDSGVFANEVAREYLGDVDDTNASVTAAIFGVDQGIADAVAAHDAGGRSFGVVAGAASVAEGGTATFTLTTRGVAPGHRLDYALSGNGITSGDIVGGALTGSAIVGADGTVAVTIGIAADNSIDEGNETLQLSVVRRAVSASVQILDTSAVQTRWVLTPGIDSIVGSAIADTITGVNAVLNAGDAISGGGGTDLLKISTDAAFPGNAAPSFSGFTLAGVENVEATNSSALGAASYDMSGSTGLQRLSSVASSKGVVFGNVPSLAALEGRQLGGAADLRIRYADALIAGAADTARLDLSSSTAGVVQVGRVGDVHGGVETLEVHASGANTVAQLDSQVSTLDMNGVAVSLSITAPLATTLRVVSAAAATGALGFSLRGNAAGVSVATGAGADTVELGSGADTVHSGAGDDVLVAGANFDASADAGGVKHDVLDGGAGTNTLQAAAGSVDAQWAQVSVIQALVLLTSGKTVLGANAQQAGLHSVLGTQGNDSIEAGAFTAPLSVQLGTGTDTLHTGSGNDSIDSAHGSGHDGNKWVDSGAGADTVSLGDGDNTVFAGDGNDTVSVGNGFNLVEAGAGDDVVVESGTAFPEIGGSNTLRGGDGNDTISFDSEFANYVEGGDGNDTIRCVQPGTVGFYNLLTGGPGSDTIEMGLGRDIARYIQASDSWGTSATRDVIEHFHHAEDAILLETVLVGEGFTQLAFHGNVADFGEAQLAMVPGDGVVDWAYDTSTHRLLVDLNDDGVLNALDLAVTMVDVEGGLMQAGDVFIDDRLAPLPPPLEVLRASDMAAGAVGSGTATSETHFLVTGTTEHDATVLVFDHGLYALGVTQADAAGNWSTTSITLGNGLHEITARALDAAGNLGDPSAVQVFTVDPLAPLVTLVGVP